MESSSHKHKPESTQAGNPHQLTKNQHVFPRASIERFAGPLGGVDVFLLSQNRYVPNINPKDKLFCVQRVWDQRAESGHMLRIENEFQFLVGRIMQGDMAWWELEKHAVTRMWFLWLSRTDVGYSPRPAAKTRTVQYGPALPKDAREVLEKKHTAFIDENGEMNGRIINGLHVQISVMHNLRSAGPIHWSVVRAADDAGEFLVPDSPSPVRFIPVSPKIILLEGVHDQIFREADLMKPTS